MSTPSSSSNNDHIDESSPDYIVAIGASAGGLEALEEFFNSAPDDTNACYIVVQHLSPDFKSMMPELLSKHTNMPIYQVSEGFTLEKNSIYLMPARSSMLIDNKTLHLSDQNPYRHLHMPIDIFFNSLAHDQQHKAIGIILSGTGSDGSRGIKTIKELGGLVIIQDPKSAKFDGMPNSAQKTGLVDLVLRPREMGQYIEKFVSRPNDSSSVFNLKSDTDTSDNKLDKIFFLLKRQSKINFSQYKATTVARRIERRLAITESNNLDSYLDYLMQSQKEVQILCRELLINVTRFFRDDESFEYLAQKVIPQVVKKAIDTGDDVRVWIAACSTGEEAYSFAILIDEELKKQQAQNKVKIFATDVDVDAIAIASAGIYSRDISSDVSEERLENYFEMRENAYEISQHIRQMIIFAAHNMIDDAPFSNLHLVSCRNVLIYFQHAAQKKVLSSLYFSLQRDGYLFLGSSESLGDIKTQYQTESEKHKIFKKTTNMRVPLGSAPPIRDLMPISRNNATNMAPIASVLRAQRVSGKNPLSTVLERLIKDYAPDCIVLNENHDALHVYGDVSLYTKGVVAGRISNNIKDMIIDDLSVAISTALYRCDKNASDVYYKDVVIKTGESAQRTIDLSVLYVRENDLPSTPTLFVVQFVQKNEDREVAPKRISYDATEQSRQRIRDLEQELIKNQEHLQVTIEELETTNEELQATNEELMSANEEMQSTNEELQSVNEELYTVNSEYQEKISLLTEANNDLDGVLNATDIGIIFLDGYLAIRKFTPSSASFINLRENDIGRPFHHISHQLHYDELLNDVSQVSNDGVVIEKEIISEKKQNLFIRICPYRKSSSTNNPGVLITITNISRLRFIEDALENAQNKIRSGYLESDEPVAKKPSRSKKVSILLVDDNEADLTRAQRMLNGIPKLDTTIRTALDIKQALSEAKEMDGLDLCLSDYNLITHTAKDLQENLKENGIHAPMIVLSGFSEDGLDAEFLNNSVSDFLNKDELSSSLLARSIDYVLEKKDIEKKADVNQ